MSGALVFLLIITFITGYLFNSFEVWILKNKIKDLKKKYEEIMSEPIINGIDVSKCEHYDIDNNYCDQSYLGEGGLLKNTKNPKRCESSPNCYFKQLKRLQEENEKIKKQYNCYACGNCKGVEDYINLEKHHKGLRKQFDAFVKKNNTLSLRIEELEKENEELKKENKNYAKLMLEQQEISQKYWECIEKIKQAIEVLAETCNVYPLKTNLDKLITTINEVFNDN